MSIIYRPHRPRLDESIKKSKEFDTEQEMKEYVVKEWNGYFTVDDIIIDTKVNNDTRVGWEDSRYVCTRKFGDIDNIEKYGSAQCIGMCATKYNK